MSSTYLPASFRRETCKGHAEDGTTSARSGAVLVRERRIPGTISTTSKLNSKTLAKEVGSV